MITRSIVLGLVAFVASISLVDASTITFENGGTYPTQASNGVQFIVNTSSSGYHFTYSGSTGSSAYIGQSTVCTPACTSDGTTALYSNGITVTIDQFGPAFSLTSIDAAVFQPNLNEVLDLVITAGSVSTTLTSAAGAADTFHAYALSGYNNITSFTLSGGAADLQFAVDNIVLGVTAVPEPSTWTMMILGFVGLGFFRYQKSRNGTAFPAA